MVKFCDKLVRTIMEYKMEISSILPPKDKIISLIFQIFTTKCNYKMSPNLIKFLNLCEAFLWTQYIYVKIKRAQLKRRINVKTINSIISTLYNSSFKLSKEDSTGQLSKLCGFLQPLLSNMSHQFWLKNVTLLSLFLSFTNEFNI
jgi:hypothetical protein